MAETTLAEIQTPYLLVDRDVVAQNIGRMTMRMRRLGVTFRPHVKTAKSVEIVNQIFDDRPGPITVSTLAEAEWFASAGYNDIVYAVGIEPAKLSRVESLMDRGVRISILVDDLQQVAAVARCTKGERPFSMLIEIDCDGQRSGVRPDSPSLLELSEAVAEAGRLRGVLTHAGGSYSARGRVALEAAAEKERHSAVAAATRIRKHGLDCPVVSIGSTPTASTLTSAPGVTEVRAGNFVFYDLVMAGIGVCEERDIAMSVVASVIGAQRDRGQILIDAGWAALSADRGAPQHFVDHGFGRIMSMEGTLYPDLIVSRVNQEHGVLEMRDPRQRVPDLCVGQRVRVLPNHACATAAQHDKYIAVGTPRALSTIEVWARSRGW